MEVLVVQTAIRMEQEDHLEKEQLQYCKGYVYLSPGSLHEHRSICLYGTDSSVRKDLRIHLSIKASFKQFPAYSFPESVSA